jgi:hypothetical protein
MGASKYALHSMYWRRKLEKTLSWNNQVVEDYKELCCKVTEYNSKGWEAHERFQLSRLPCPYAVIDMLGWTSRWCPMQNGRVMLALITLLSDCYDKIVVNVMKKQ